MLERDRRRPETKRGEVIKMEKITFLPRLASGIPIIIHYCVAGDEIFFSSTTPNTTSSINCAEEIVIHICQREGISPKYTDFYDINTHLGYRDLEAGEARIFRLELDYSKPYGRSRFSVNSWQLLESPAGYPIPEGTTLTGIPPVIREMFAPYIGTAHPNTPSWSTRLWTDTFGSK